MRYFSRNIYEGLGWWDQRELNRYRDQLAKEYKTFRKSGSSIMMDKATQRATNQQALDEIKKKSEIYADYLRKNPSAFGKALKKSAYAGVALGALYGAKKLYESESNKQFSETMNIQKIFSDYNGTERYYSVLMSEDDLRLFSMMQKNFGFWDRITGKDKLKKQVSDLTQELEKQKVLQDVEKKKGFLRKNWKGLTIGAGLALGGKYLLDNNKGNSQRNLN